MNKERKSYNKLIHIDENAGAAINRIAKQEGVSTAAVFKLVIIDLFRRNGIEHAIDIKKGADLRRREVKDFSVFHTSFFSLAIKEDLIKLYEKDAEVLAGYSFPMTFTLSDWLRIQTLCWLRNAGEDQLDMADFYPKGTMKRMSIAYMMQQKNNWLDILKQHGCLPVPSVNA